MINCGAREDVLEFYRKLPFNSNEKPEVVADLIRKINNADLLQFNCSPKDIVISIGVLHRTSSL